MFIGLIYLIINLINGKKYVGQTTQKINPRWAQHKADAKRGRNLPLHAAIRKYGVENFEIKQIAKVTSETKEEGVEWLNIIEPLYIVSHSSLVPNGYNLDSGGKNKLMHPDSKAKMRKARIGKPNNQLGKKRSPETKTNISNACKGRIPWNKGIPHTQQAKDNISAARKGRPWSQARRDAQI